MKKLILILIALLFQSCVVKKEVNIMLYDSEKTEVDVLLQGSDLEDIKPDLEIPLAIP